MNRFFGIAVLLIFSIGSAMAVVYVKHESRNLFSQLRQVQKQQDRAMLLWSRLQLQKSTLVTQSNVEQVARDKLAMKLPEQIQIILRRPYD